MTENDDIKVNDKRRFKMSDNTMEEGSNVQEEHMKDEVLNNDISSNKEENAQEQEDVISNPGFKISFIDLINSLAGTTLIQLGAVADPQTNIIKKDLGAAKQTIDILELLKEKTTGNLNNDESMMLDNVLFDLRMRYVLVSEAKK
jgi:hypothetical protein